jgi:hypothetical protein
MVIFGSLTKVVSPFDDEKKSDDVIDRQLSFYNYRLLMHFEFSLNDVLLILQLSADTFFLFVFNFLYSNQRDQ